MVGLTTRSIAPGITVLVTTTRWYPRFFDRAFPTILAADFTNSIENSPDALLGVGTTTKVASVSLTALSWSIVAERESRFDLIRRPTPGSKIGDRPLFTELTLRSSTSTPMTWNPRSARTAARLSPSCPSPITEMRLISMGGTPFQAFISSVRWLSSNFNPNAGAWCPRGLRPDRMVWRSEGCPFLAMPLDGPFQAGLEVDLRFPPETPCPADVEGSAERALWLAPVVKHSLRCVTRCLEYQVGDVPDLVPLFPTEIDGGGVADLFCAQKGAANYVVYECETSLLVS